MTNPENLKYTKSHEWVREMEDCVEIGLTDFAQESLGDLVFVNLPQEGDTVTVGESFADVESVKAVSDVYCPVSGTVIEVNEELLDSPEKINQAPYEAWLIRVADVSARAELLDATAYQAIAKED